ncbi:MAG TPA: hypothetical protein VFQ87_01500 [Bradyrhizobium sp.]|jgi:hypothetical protein|nr:hypothetical protein [Bradyrhizobium sp.]
MAYQSSNGVPLANGMRLNHGQLIGPSPSIATKSTRAKTGIARDDDGSVIARRGDNVALSGAAKKSGAVPIKPGMRPRTTPGDLRLRSNNLKTGAAQREPQAEAESAAGEVLEVSGALRREADILRDEIHAFLANIRAA